MSGSSAEVQRPGRQTSAWFGGQNNNIPFETERLELKQPAESACASVLEHQQRVGSCASVSNHIKIQETGQSF